MRLRMLFGVVLAVVLILTMPSGIAAQPNTRKLAPSSRDTVKYESWLSERVRHELVMLPWLGVFDHLAYKVQGERVTLLGYTVRSSIRSGAENVVKKIEGVRQVDNRIEVLPPSPNDDRIRRDTFRAIYGDTVLSRYGWGAVPQIHIIVNRGQLILEGVVDSQTDKDIAGIRASGVFGAFTVTNNLQVKK